MKLLTRLLVLMVVVSELGTAGADPILASPDPAADPSIPEYLRFNVVDLGFDANAINNSGQIVGSDSGNAVLWDPAHGLSVISPGYAVDINDFGHIVGSQSVPGIPGPDAGWIFDPDFGLTLVDGLTDPRAINNHGQVLTGNNSVNSNSEGSIWTPDLGFVDLPKPSGDFLGPNDINDFGVAVGGTATSAGNAWYWQSGDPELQYLSSVDPNRNAAGPATAINNAGVIGVSLALPSQLDPEIPACDSRWCFRAAVYFDAEPQIIALGNVGDINEHNLVVGGGAFRDVFPFLWSQTFGLQNLDSLVDPSDPLFGIAFDAGTSINDRGQIIADRRYLLTPIAVPEPGTLPLLLVGLAGVYFVTRRRRFHAKEFSKKSTSRGTFVPGQNIVLI